MKALALIVLLATAARADVQYCRLDFGGALPETLTQVRQCHRLEGQIFRRLRRLCDKYPGTNICVRFLRNNTPWNTNPWGVGEGDACSLPLPTLAECCTAGFSVLGATGQTLCPPPPTRAQCCGPEFGVCPGCVCRVPAVP